MEVQLDLKENGRGSFLIKEEGKQIGEMAISIASGNLTVYHTEVNDEYQGKGVSTQLLTAMVDYARSHKLKVVPLCAYVNTQFKRHPAQYEDVWSQTWHNK
ncbi:MAG: GNAT family N-acetyltransferase [Chryseolinea sp.]